MTSNEKRYWFPAKRFGWGWGVPITWQGWAVLLVYLGLIWGGAAALLASHGVFVFMVYTSILTAVFLAICQRKGEPLHRGGK
ncbi:hypothetical protein HNQ59_001464 [Chitinivorax tropicus]|uniref:Uncharacterized protein n=1 Tax=Chitinivorax tropicus TaxID=714531 RepID=A0A840MM22_9PROT|nr:hypothetical protein [Chitinivorax tropicus]MBB5018179.1 hypothetical protein [Chitinivorax tropicus]